MLRLSSSLATGESEVDFLRHEAQTQAAAYENVYEQKLESLKKWTDSYIALTISVALVIVVTTISSIIYEVGTVFVTGLVGMMLAFTGLGAWVIFRTVPKELKTLIGPQGRKSQRVPRTLALILVPIAVVLAALIVLAGIPTGWALAAMGAALLPIGVAARRLRP